MEFINGENSNENILEINAIKKSKRILLFLADYFIIFILSFVIHNAMVYPISNAIVNNNEIALQAYEAKKNRDDILYNNEILFYKDIDSKYDFATNVEYTFDRFLSYYALNSDDVISSDPNLGKKENNEIFKHYYLDIKNNINAYKDFIKKYDVKSYFEIYNNQILMKETIRKDMRLYFLSIEDMSIDGKYVLLDIENYFLNIYNEIFADINKNDLSYKGESYLFYQSKVSQYNEFVNQQNVVTALITYVISWLISYIIYPLINKQRRTISMSLLKIDRIGTNNLFLIKKVDTIIIGLYSLFLCASNIFFIPMTTLGFNAVFNLPLIISISIISLLILIISMFIIIFSSFNRSGLDYLSRTVLIEEKDLDAIWKVKSENIHNGN